MILGTHGSLEAWLEDMHPRLARFEDLLMPAGWTGGYSRESLEQLEQHMLQRWPDQKSFLDAPDADWVDGAVRYIGETYLRVAGGGWEYDDDPESALRGSVVVRPDTLSRIPVSPYHLMTALLSRRTGAELAKVYDGQLRQIQRRRDAEGPDWEPVREPVPGMTTPERDPGDSPERDAWVARVDERIAALRAGAGASAGALDLTPTSLAALERLALEELPSTDPASPEGAEAVARYASYLGAVLLAQAGGRWVLRPGPADDDDPFVGRPFVKRDDAAGSARAGLVHSVVEILARDPQPGLFEGVRAAYVD